MKSLLTKLQIDLGAKEMTISNLALEPHYWLSGKPGVYASVREVEAAWYKAGNDLAGGGISEMEVERCLKSEYRYWSGLLRKNDPFSLANVLKVIPFAFAPAEAAVIQKVLPKRSRK